MKNYIAICILTAHIFSGTLFSAEMTHADTTLCGIRPHNEQELRVAVLELMLNAKLSSFAPYDNRLVTPHEPCFIAAIKEVEKIITMYMWRQQDPAVVSVCVEWLFGRILDPLSDTEYVVPESIALLNQLGTQIGLIERIRDLLAEDCEEDSVDDSLCLGSTHNESMESNHSQELDFFDTYYTEQKALLLAALWEWARTEASAIR
jgi:hypothetical protein